MLEKTKADYLRKLGPQTRAWARTLDALLVLLVMLALVIMLFVLPPVKPVFIYLILFALGCSAVLAITLYRQTDLHQIERIAILGLLLCIAGSLLVALIELGGKT